MTKRASLTKRERADMLLAQGGKCGCGCGRDIGLHDSDAEHGLPVGLGNTNKPDSLWARACHRGKTAKDRARMAKADRQRKYHLGLKKRRGKQIQSRGFNKTMRKKFNGDVEVRG